MAKRMMTTTSMVTVTPSTMRVKGPLARSSLMMAMADEGERAHQNRGSYQSYGETCRCWQRCHEGNRIGQHK